MKNNKFISAISQNSNLIDLIILIFLFLFLFSFFAPQYMFSVATTSGGDMGSHYPTAVYMKESILRTGRIMFWERGNYAGFPMFYHYFPLTYVIMFFVSFIVPMEVAFKLVSVLGTFLLPVCVYLAFRCLKYPFPIPIMAGCFSLAFLFLEANSMWGGNIPSTLAGEFSYSLSLSLTILFFGTLYCGISQNKWIILNALLIFLVGMSHGFTLIFSGVTALFFLFTKKDFLAKFFYLFKVFGLAGLLISFWFIPFLANVPYVTSYVTRWHIKSVFEVFPRILMPFMALSFASFFLNLFDRRTWYFCYVFAACTILYYLAPKIGMLDIRFIPFIQLYLVIFSATFMLVFLDKVKSRQLLAFIALLLVLIWIVPNVTFIKGWIKWNYEGFEEKAAWPLFKKINDYLKETGPGRVVYEHSPVHNSFGTERAFENLPYFARRDTLEGLYMQSSISSPFVFYIQSEVSKVCSGPFPQYKYTHLNLPAAIKRLEMFNVTHYLARSPEAKEQAKTIPELKLEKQFDDYEIYRLTSNDGHYVVPLACEPVLFKTDNWKRDFHEWFRRLDLLDVHLVYSPRDIGIDSPHLSVGNRALIKFAANDLLSLPKVPIAVKNPQIKEEIKNEEIVFDTNLVGYPHLIKVSYHPNWKVEGAEEIYLVSPSFMLVYPKQQKVRLYFGKTIFNYLGGVLSVLGLSIVLISGIIFLKHVRKT